MTVDHRAELAELRGIVKKLRALHVARPYNWIIDGMTHGVQMKDQPDRCSHCRAAWPCPTMTPVLALDSADV